MHPASFLFTTGAAMVAGQAGEPVAGVGRRRYPKEKRWAHRAHLQ